jgi:hypothetical protein
LLDKKSDFSEEWLDIDDEKFSNDLFDE